MVVAVNLSSKHVNSLAFAQLDKSSQEIEFRSKVQTLKNEYDSLGPQKKDAKTAATTARDE